MRSEDLWYVGFIAPVLAAQMNELTNAQEFLQRILFKKVEPQPKATTPH